MSARDDGGPAFPQHLVEDPTGGFTHGADGYGMGGMSMRNYVAIKAMQGLLAGIDHEARRFLEKQDEPVQTLVNAAYKMADAMLRASKS